MSDKKPSKKEISTLKKIILLIACCLIVTMIGCGIANYTPIGFVLIAVGMNGFILFVVISVCKSQAERTKYGRYLNVDKSLLKDFYDIKTGIVTKCQIHSRAYNSRKVNGYSGDLYKIWVVICDNDIDNTLVDTSNDIAATNISENKIVYNMLAQKQYNTGDKVEFYQNKSNYKDCYLIK